MANSPRHHFWTGSEAPPTDEGTTRKCCSLLRNKCAFSSTFQLCAFSSTFQLCVLALFSSYVHLALLSSYLHL